MGDITRGKDEIDVGRRAMSQPGNESDATLLDEAQAVVSAHKAETR